MVFSQLFDYKWLQTKGVSVLRGTIDAVLASRRRKVHPSARESEGDMGGVKGTKSKRADVAPLREHRPRAPKVKEEGPLKGPAYVAGKKPEAPPKPGAESIQRGARRMAATPPGQRELVGIELELSENP